MAFDTHANFAITTVATAPSPATSGTSIVLAAGAGALMPTVPFNATVFANGQLPVSTNAEIVRAIARPGAADTFTITRIQESSVARTVIVGDQFMAGITTKTLTDIESAINGIVGGGGAANYQTVQVSGAAQTARSVLDFAPGVSLSITATDDAANNRTIVTFAVSAIDGGLSA